MADRRWALAILRTIRLYALRQLRHHRWPYLHECLNAIHQFRSQFFFCELAHNTLNTLSSPTYVYTHVHIVPSLSGCISPLTVPVILDVPLAGYHSAVFTPRSTSCPWSSLFFSVLAAIQPFSPFTTLAMQCDLSVQSNFFSFSFFFILLWASVCLFKFPVCDDIILFHGCSLNSDESVGLTLVVTIRSNTNPNVFVSYNQIRTSAESALKIHLFCQWPQRFCTVRSLFWGSLQPSGPAIAAHVSDGVCVHQPTKTNTRDRVKYQSPARWQMLHESQIHGSTHLWRFEWVTVDLDRSRFCFTPSYNLVWIWHVHADRQTDIHTHTRLAKNILVYRTEIPSTTAPLFSVSNWAARVLVSKYYSPGREWKKTAL